ncbi:hypothetical protein [Paenibacillus sp. Marseille-Q4541]|uniref:hypothetical protein n=1 Tax=Paenibacillus sp. Marseille-Q4541 TaxID=2831522 RepID=UPI001BAB2286|nr:hypothetical protein [Paenibacillus sp. Marseille-Q4541]
MANEIKVYTGVKIAGVETTSDGRMKVDIGGANINATLGDIKSAIKAHTFHNSETKIAEGNLFTVESYKSMTIEIYGTATSATVNFKAVSASGVSRPISGIRISDLSLGTSGSINEIWQIDITGLESIAVEIVSLSGGSLTAKGKAVA